MGEDRYDIVIVGGGAGGVPVALRAKRYYKDKSVLLITKEHKAVIPCAIPYVPYSIESCDRALLPYDALTKLGVNIVVDEVVDVDRKNKRVIVASGKTYGYDKLILAIGGAPSIPPIDGVDLKGVMAVYKGYEKVVELQKALRSANKIVVVGGGFVGVELADDLADLKKDVTIVEILPHCLLLNFDEEFAVKAEEQLKRKGVKIITGRAVKKIYGKERAEGVELDNGERMPADLVIIAIGYRPNVELAKRIGLRTGTYGIAVDDYMRTSDPDIFAIGDCAEKRHFLLGEPTPLLLASIACQEANIAIMNLYGAKTTKRISGWTGTFVTKVGDLVLGCAGVTESFAKKRNLAYVVGRSKVVNRHPAWFPGGCEVELKLIFLKDGTLIGAQGASMCHEVAEMINALSIALQNKMRIDEIITMEFASHPKLTASPGANPIVVAALDALTKL
jgi:NADPH-dependent 2,4-dienoyl-CoA reductase/sulfur reductase-like enzyme